VDTAGNIYVADEVNNKIRKITPAGVVTTLAGSGAAGSANGIGASASFAWPSSIAVDAYGNVYVPDNNRIRIISPAGVVVNMQEPAGQNEISDIYLGGVKGIAIDSSGNLYASCFNSIYTLQKNGMYWQYSRAFGDGYAEITTYDDGSYQTYSTGVGRFLDSRSSSGVVGSLNNPIGVAVDSSGNVYIADTGNFAIRKGYDPYRLSTLAGCGISGSQDGVGSQATFSAPTGVAVDSSGNVYVADGLKIRKITIIGN
jgi:sugar lactone lactonase YvrE